MQITKLELNRYKNLRSFRETFDRGINLIKGPNEAGKSSIVEAITDLFFTDPGSSRKELKEKIGWDSERSFDLTMEFSIEGQMYRLHKDFEKGETSLLKQSSGEEIVDKKNILNIIESGLGMANRDIYLATTTIRQDEIGTVSKSADAIKDKLEGMITAGQEEVLASDAINKLESSIRDINKQGSKHLGVIQKLEKNKDELIYELDKAKREIDLVGKNRAKLKETQGLLEGIRTEYATKKSHMEKAEQAMQKEEKLKALEERFQDLNSRVTSIQSSENTIEDLKRDLASLPKINYQDLSHAEQQSAQLRYLESKAGHAEEKVEELAEKYALARPGMFMKLTTAFMFFLSAAAFAYWSFIINMSDNRFLFGALGGIVLFVSFLVFWLNKAGHARAIKLQCELKKASQEEIESDMEDSKVAIETILEKYKVPDISTLKSKFEQYRDLEKDFNSEVKRYEKSLGGKTLRDLQKELEKVTMDLAVENEAARDLKLYVMNAAEKEKLVVLVDALEKQKANLESTEIALKRQLEFAESGCELQASLEERLQEVETALERSKYQVKIYETAKKYIEKARKDILKASIGALEEETSQILQQVTSGKYTKVRFDRQSLRFEVYSPLKDDWLDPDISLSHGTRDQLYLAARMALVRVISQERKPVLIFDEPFLTFDAERRQNAMKILKQYSGSYQILVFSCNNYYDQIAENTVSLAEAEVPMQKAGAF